MLKKLLGRFSRDMGIDLGTANTLVFVSNQGIVLQEPTVVAFDRDSGNIIAVGLEAKQMVGRTPGSIVAVRPLKDGVIADFEVTEKMLQYYIKKAGGRRAFLRPALLLVFLPGSRK